MIQSNYLPCITSLLYTVTSVVTSAQKSYHYLDNQASFSDICVLSNGLEQIARKRTLAKYSVQINGNKILVKVSDTYLDPALSICGTWRRKRTNEKISGEGSSRISKPTYVKTSSTKFWLSGKDILERPVFRRLPHKTWLNPALVSTWWCLFEFMETVVKCGSAWSSLNRY